MFDIVSSKSGADHWSMFHSGRIKEVYPILFMVVQDFSHFNVRTNCLVILLNFEKVWNRI